MVKRDELIIAKRKACSETWAAEDRSFAPIDLETNATTPIEIIAAKEYIIQMTKTEEITAAKEVAPNFPTQKALAIEKKVSRNIEVTAGQARRKMFLVTFPEVRSKTFCSFISTIFLCVILTPPEAGEESVDSSVAPVGDSLRMTKNNFSLLAFSP
jgi:hypothetical protein